MNFSNLVFLIPLVLSFLAFIFPYKSSQSASSIGYGTLKSKYSKWEHFAVFPLFGYIILFTYLLGQLALSIFNQLKVESSDVCFLLLPPSFMWYAVSCLLTFGLITVPMNITYKLILGADGYEEYLMYTNIKNGFDGMKVLRPIFFIFSIFATIGFFLLTDYSIKIFKDKIEFDDFLSLKPRSQNISSINAIHFVKMVKYKKEDAEKPHHYIEFKDGSFWDTNDGIGAVDKETEMIQFLVKESKVKMDTLKYNPN